MIDENDDGSAAVAAGCDCGPLHPARAHRGSCPVAERSLRESYEVIGRAMGGRQEQQLVERPEDEDDGYPD